MRHLLGTAALAVAIVACTGDEASAFGRRGVRGSSACCAPTVWYYSQPACPCLPYTPAPPAPPQKDTDPDPMGPPPPPPKTNE